MQHGRTKYLKKITYRPSVVIWRAPPLRLHRQHSCRNTAPSELDQKTLLDRPSFPKNDYAISEMQRQTVPSHHPSLMKYLIHSHAGRADAYRCPRTGWAPWARPTFIHQVWTYSVTAWKKQSHILQSFANISLVGTCWLFSSEASLKSGVTFEQLHSTVWAQAKVRSKVVFGKGAEFGISRS